MKERWCFCTERLVKLMVINHKVAMLPLFSPLHSTHSIPIHAHLIGQLRLYHTASEKKKRKEKKK